MDYALSYRRGYFADSDGTEKPREKPRTLLLADGKTAAAPDVRSDPIVFEARVLPAAPIPDAAGATPVATVAAQAPKKRTIPYSIHYSVPVSAFTPKTVDGKAEIDLGVAVFAFTTRALRKRISPIASPLT